MVSDTLALCDFDDMLLHVDNLMPTRFKDAVLRSSDIDDPCHAIYGADADDCVEINGRIALEALRNSHADLLGRRLHVYPEYMDLHASTCAPLVIFQLPMSYAITCQHLHQDIMEESKGFFACESRQCHLFLRSVMHKMVRERRRLSGNNGRVLNDENVAFFFDARNLVFVGRLAHDEEQVLQQLSSAVHDKIDAIFATGDLVHEPVLLLARSTAVLDRLTTAAAFVGGSAAVRATADIGFVHAVEAVLPP
jgi:hypothetical protein